MKNLIKRYLGWNSRNIAEFATLQAVYNTTCNLQSLVCNLHRICNLQHFENSAPDFESVSRLSVFLLLMCFWDPVFTKLFSSIPIVLICWGSLNWLFNESNSFILKQHLLQFEIRNINFLYNFYNSQNFIKFFVTYPKVYYFFFRLIDYNSIRFSVHFNHKFKLILS